jgi:Ca2+-binding RTX toxin-like protein
VELVSKLEPLSQGPVGDDQLADVAVHNGFAYVQSGWNCEAGKGGFYVIDIRNPAAPVEVNFTPALPSSYHGEGAQVIPVNTPSFSGDVLAVNNESCAAGLTRGGGFDLYDVSNPANPQILTQGFGDFGGEGDLTAGPGDDTKANEAHSIFIWDAGDEAYAVIVDNEELHDVDIFDITDPRDPQPVREYDLFDTAPEAFSDDANVGTAFHHDMVVKNIGGSFKLLSSYWDAGYIQLNADDPANLVYEGDTDFGGTDPLTGFNPPEGNAHEAEYTFDNRFFVTGEEDFAPFRVEFIDIENVGRRDAAMVPGGVAPNFLDDGIMNGPTAYVGYACDGSAPVPTPAEAGMPAKEEGEEWIAVVQRGPAYDPDEDYDGDGDIANDSDDSCFPGDKAANIDDAGWDAVLYVNRHTASGTPPVAGGAAGDGVNCGSGGFDRPVVAVCTTHAAFHEMFNDAVTYEVPYDDSDVPATGDHALPAEGPNIGDHGEKITAEGLFDGWGYTSLYSTTRDENGKFPLADAHAIKEALNPAYSFGFGDLSIHEQAADPTEPLSYSSYYSGGMRVFSFEAGKFTEQGAFIDEGGNDMWGVEQFTTGTGERLFAGSDRDYGLYVLRYTGPLAPKRPACSDVTAMVPYKGSGGVPLTCSDPNGNPLRESIVSGPSSDGALSGNPDSGAVTFTHTGDTVGEVSSFTFKANDGAADSNVATANIVAVPRAGGRCFNRFEGTADDDVIVGSPFGDSIRGRAGKDDIRGSGGVDCLRGDNHADRVIGGGGGDTLTGGGRGDFLRGGDGRDRVRGQAGNDRVYGDEGNDRLFGDGGRDRVIGGAGNDRLFAGGGPNRLNAGPGNDVLRVANGRRDKVNCGSGRDRVVGAEARDLIKSNCEVVQFRR